jgi:hypothetical protein
MLQEIIKTVEAGITVVCAAGNSGDAMLTPRNRLSGYIRKPFPLGLSICKRYCQFQQLQ